VEDSFPQRSLRLASAAPAPRTLVEILHATAHAHPAATALEDAKGSLSYRDLVREVNKAAVALLEAGVRRGDRVGVRIPSGTRTLYISILATLTAGAAYVPVDADDPQERADLVFGEAQVCGVIGADGLFIAHRELDAHPLLAEHPGLSLTAASAIIEPPTLEDDAWIIFTSGSTGVPKGVAVTHRSAAAFVDAEAHMFLPEAPLGTQDRVLAGLSVAFDASCEEMWLAWRHGAALVPAPRSLVRSGADLGPWLIRNGITVVSTVPTLAGLWPQESLEAVRLLIFGGEACPPDLAARLAVEGREVWNTYGPTEATVVSCGALMDGEGPIRIGLPLEGWDLAVVDPEGQLVAEGEIGELIIGGVGLARYLDPAKDAEKYAPMPTLGWERAYRSGDLVRYEAEGLLFQGRADDQIKLGGRRIELGEIDAALMDLQGVAGAAAVVQTTPAGNQILVGYIALGADVVDFNLDGASARLREELPAALVPLLAVVDEIPTRISGKVDRAALPWPLPNIGEGAATGLSETGEWLASHWSSILGMPVSGPKDDFFAHGGGSLTAAQLVSAIRQRFPDARVADIYDHPRIGALADELDARTPAAAEIREPVQPASRTSRFIQTLLGFPLYIISGLRWMIYLLAINNVLALNSELDWLMSTPWLVVIAGLLIFVTPLGRMTVTVLIARAVLVGVTPGVYRRGGSVHLRVWFAQRCSEIMGAADLAGAPWMIYYARALGAQIGAGVDLHTLPPITGLIKIGAGASIEPEVDLAGYWLDGDEFRIGRIFIGTGATIGARSTLLPNARVGKGAEIEPGSAVYGHVPAGQMWGGSPATRQGKAGGDWPEARPPRGTGWVFAFAIGSLLLALLPLLAAVPALFLLASDVLTADTLGDLLIRTLLWLPLVVLSWVISLALLTILAVRLLSLGLREGVYPVRSRVGWQVWATERLLDAARTQLFPLYASLITPLWLRALGAKVGSNVEASTVLLLPCMTTIGNDAFLADDTMIAGYELGHGWMRIAPARVGRRGFLGNSGMTGPGRQVPNNGLVAVLSRAPRKARKGSSWLGNPPMRLRRAVAEFDDSRTYDPPFYLKLSRALWEICRVVPLIVSAGLGLGVVAALQWILLESNAWLAALAAPAVLLAAAVAAALITTAMKWLLVGKIVVAEHPLWSSFVWRNEVADTFVETVAAPWFANLATGSPVLSLWLRTLGVRVGAGVWCETYWLPEADLVTLHDAAVVNRGCVVQTHLFHDRVMQLDAVTIGSGATLGPHSVILPAASLGAHATVGPASLVMRGESLPSGSSWGGNPITTWNRVSQ
jgi:non-ribosomal peptide synthetase-like protein